MLSVFLGISAYRARPGLAGVSFIIAYSLRDIYSHESFFSFQAPNPGRSMKAYPAFSFFFALAFFFRAFFGFLLCFALLSTPIPASAEQAEAREKTFQEMLWTLLAGFDGPGTLLLLATPEERCIDSFLLQNGAAIRKKAESRNFALARPFLDGNGLSITLFWAAQREAFESFWVENWPFFKLERLTHPLPEGGVAYSAVMRADFPGMVWETCSMRSIAALQQRIAAAGVSEWRVHRFDREYTAVWLGTKDPQVLAKILPKPELLGFHLVRDDLRPEAGGLSKKVVLLPVKAQSGGEEVSGQRVPVEIPAKLTGESLISVSAVLDHSDGPHISLAFDREGAKALATFTGDNIGRRLAIVSDGVIYVMPMIVEKISGGEVSLRGNFSPAEAGELAERLNSVFLPVPLTLLHQQTVGP